MKHVLIVGATSSIAQHTARRWAADGHSIFLVARDAERLLVIQKDLIVRGANDCAFTAIDLNRLDLHAGMLDEAESRFGPIDIALIAHGSLGDQEACEGDFNLALGELQTNAISVLSLLTLLANRMESRRRGQLAVIGSVAGDRGRVSNYVYGTAKAAVDAFTSGLRVRLRASGVSLLLVKPGPIDTPMTAALPKGPLWGRPEAVAGDIISGVERRRSVIYTPRFWWLIMFVVRHLPQFVFERTRF